MPRFLRSQSEAGRTLERSRGTDSGKTTLLHALTRFHPRLGTHRELRIEKPNVLAAECRAGAHEDRADFDDLLKAPLRWEAGRILLGEMRGVEAVLCSTSFHTGHAGSTAAMHASSAVPALDRFSEPAMYSNQQAARDDLCAALAKARADGCSNAAPGNESSSCSRQRAAHERALRSSRVTT